MRTSMGVLNIIELFEHAGFISEVADSSVISSSTISPELLALLDKSQ